MSGQCNKGGSNVVANEWQTWYGGIVDVRVVPIRFQGSKKFRKLSVKGSLIVKDILLKTTARLQLSRISGRAKQWSDHDFRPAWLGPRLGARPCTSLRLLSGGFSQFGVSTIGLGGLAA